MAKLIFPTDSNEAKRLARAVNNGSIKRIRAGVYTDASWEEVPQLLHNHWFEVVNHLYPTAIASHSTAVSLCPVNNAVFITAEVKTRKKVKVSDALTLEVLPGDVSILTEPFQPEMFRSSPPRYLLENLQVSHSDVETPKSLGKEWVERELCKLLERYGENELNRIRDQARQYCDTVKMEKAFKQLDKLIGAVLSTHSIDALSTHQAIAMAKKVPFDSNRLTTLDALKDYLTRCELKAEPYHYQSSSWRNLAFYESYFSNYIEGTEFEIDEAEKIVFEKSEIENRHQDSHDLLSVYDVVHDYTEMCTVPDSPDELLQLLLQRHALIMHQRPDKRPGLLKEKTNKAGGTAFVAPEHVEGTLTQAFPLYQALPEGLPRAIFMQFLISECHPFDDGNGRLARIMMNAELVSAEQHKLIIPTVHRDSYLNGLRQATRSLKFRAMTKVLANLQAYTASIDWSDYGEARDSLESHCANKLPDEGVARFNKQIAKFKIDLPAL